MVQRKVVKPHWPKPTARCVSKPALRWENLQLISISADTVGATCSNINRFSALSDIQSMDDSETNINLNVTPLCLLRENTYKFCVNALKVGKMDFHSYNSKENKMYTTSLYGLLTLSPDEVSDNLKTYNLSPTMVTEVKTKYSSVNDAVYKIQFERTSFNPS